MANLSNINFTDSIQDALGGDQQAFAFLYNETYGYFRSIVVKCIGAGSNTDDVMQNIYIKIFRELHTLRDPQTFLKWGATIARREALNEYKKSKALKNDLVDYYPQTAPEDDDGMSMDDFSAADYDTDINPEAAIDAAETRRLVQEILDALPDSQRVCLVMWMDNYTNQQIAEELGMKPGTVKSNIKYAKQKVEQQVRALEKRGTKLYSLAPFAFFIWLYRMYSRSTLEVQAAELGAQSAQIFGTVMKQTTAAGKAAGGARQSAAASAAKAQTGKSGAVKAAGASERAGGGISGHAGGAGAAAGAKTGAAAAAGKSAARRIITIALCAVLAGGAAGAAVAYNVSGTDTEVVEETEEETSAEETEETVIQDDTADTEMQISYDDPDELAKELGYVMMNTSSFEMQWERQGDGLGMLSGIADSEGYVSAGFYDLDEDDEDEFLVLSFSSEIVSEEDVPEEKLGEYTSEMFDGYYKYTISVYENRDGWELASEEFVYSVAKKGDVSNKGFYVTPDGTFIIGESICTSAYIRNSLYNYWQENVSDFGQSDYSYYFEVYNSVFSIQVIEYENETLERVQFGVSDELPVYRLETQDIFDLINYEGVEEVLEEHNTELKALVTDATDEEGSLLTYEMWSIPDGSDTLLHVIYYCDSEGKVTVEFSNEYITPQFEH